MTKCSGKLMFASAKSELMKISRVRTLRAQIFVERFDADADERRQRAGGEALSDFACAGRGVSIFFVVGAIAVTVFEIEAEIFDRFAFQFLRHAVENLLRQLAFRITEHARQSRGIGRIFPQRTQGDRAEPLRGIGFEKMCAAITVCTAWRRFDSPG